MNSVLPRESITVQKQQYSVWDKNWHKLWFVGSYNFFWSFEFQWFQVYEWDLLRDSGILCNNNTCYMERLKKKKKENLSSCNENVNDIFGIFIFQVQNISLIKYLVFVTVLRIKRIFFPIKCKNSNNPHLIVSAKIQKLYGINSS